MFKGCVRYIFASLFFTAKREQEENKKYILLSNLRSKHSLLMKFGQFMSHYKRRTFIRKFYKNCDLKTSSRPFCAGKELSTTSTGNGKF